MTMPEEQHTTPEPTLTPQNQPHIQATQAPTIENTIDSPEIRQYALIIYILYLVGIVTGVSTLIGVIIAYVKRDDMANTPYADHITYLIRTFWIFFIGSFIGVVTSFLLIGMLILPLVFVWYAYRCIAGFIKFNDRKPIDPLNWF